MLSKKQTNNNYNKVSNDSRDVLFRAINMTSLFNLGIVSLHRFRKPIAPRVIVMSSEKQNTVTDDSRDVSLLAMNMTSFYDPGIASIHRFSKTDRSMRPTHFIYVSIF